MIDVAVDVRGLCKQFGPVRALDEVDMRVPAGSVGAVLGPNGAGKTTLVKILTTVLKADSGTARVAGHDVARAAEQVRYRIGVAGQQVALDGLLTGRENLVMIGRLHHLPAALARRRADDLLERFRLTRVGDRLTRTYSGGTRRRLDLAAGLLVAPMVLFLDEPTTGLDPGSRNALWDVIAALVSNGTAILLTTQYMAEAERLADRITVIDGARVIAEGTPAELKDSHGGTRLTVVVRDAGEVAEARRILRRVGAGDARLSGDPRRITAAAGGSPTGLLALAARELESAGVALEEIALRSPTLDEVFLALTARDRTVPPC
ncbi:ATP-binding cassette domain-containing protein [Asanoa sp. NPDC049573]|uniref:ATP-binding cassette domain-containing protein n=1 Tax=Asanoa sp. NPDC049573 TaxID=3155396 RepID=UPI003447A96F